VVGVSVALLLFLYLLNQLLLYGAALAATSKRGTVVDLSGGDAEAVVSGRDEGTVTQPAPESPAEGPAAARDPAGAAGSADAAESASARDSGNAADPKNERAEGGRPADGRPDSGVASSAA